MPQSLFPRVLVAVLGCLPALSTAGPAAGAEIPVRGLVLDKLGHAVTSAKVELLPVLEAVEEDRLQLQGKPLPDPKARAAVGADGRFVLTAPDAGLWVVRIEAPGFVPAEISLFPLIRKTELEPVTLQTDVRVRVRVLDPEGRPLAGARVWAGEKSRFRRDGFWALSWRWGTTDAAGLATLPRGVGVELMDAELSLFAYAPGHAPVTGRLLPDQPAADLQTAAGCPRRIEVRDGAGRPVEGAYVVSDDSSPLRGWVLGVTAEDGGLTVTAPCRQRMRLVAEVAGGRRVQAVLEPEPSGKAPSPVRLSLPPAVRWTGRVVTTDRGEPVAGALVWCSTEPGGAVRTGADGRYSLAVPWERAHRERAQEPAYVIQAAVAGSSQRPAQGVRVPGIAQAEVAGPNFAVIADPWLAGTVTDAAGTPVPGAEVFAQSSYSGTASFWVRPETSVMSDAGGWFRLEARPKETGRQPALLSSFRYHLLAVREGFVPAALTVEALEPGASRPALRLVLRRGQTAAGRIVDQEARPVSGAEVILVPARESPGRPLFPRDGDLTLPPAVRSDAEGRFALRGVRPGTFDLQVRAARLAPAARFGITIPEGEATTDLGDVMLDLGLTVEGQVVDPEGRPVEGATVRLWDPIYFASETELPPPEQAVRTGLDGRFLFTHLPRDHAVAVNAERSGFWGVYLDRVAAPAAEPLRLVVRPAFSVSGRVVNDRGEPIGPGQLMLLEAEDGSVEPRPLRGENIGRDGTFLFSLTESGKAVLLSAEVKGYAPSIPVALAGVVDRRNIEIRLQGGETLEGSVIGPDGRPVAGASVRILNEFSAGQSLSSRTDAAGRFQIPGLRTGSYTVEARHPQYMPGRREVTVQPGANWLDVRLQAGTTVTGRVVDEAGQPVAGASVDLKGTAGPPFWKWERSGPEGQFSLAGVAPGAYTLSASKTGYVSDLRQGFQVGSQPLIRVELRLAKGSILTGRIHGLSPEQLAQVVDVYAQIQREGQPFSPGSWHVRGQADASGTYRLEGLVPGDWMVFSTAGDRLRAEAAITIPPGGLEAHLDLVFEKP